LLKIYILRSSNNNYIENKYKKIKIIKKIGEGSYGLVFLLNNDHVIKIFKKSTIKNTILNDYVTLAKNSKENGRFQEIQLKEPYIQVDTLKRDWKSDKSTTGKDIAINITNSFNMLDIRPSTIVEPWPGADQQLTELQQIIHNNLTTYHAENVKFEYNNTNKNLRFDNILLLLKLILLSDFMISMFLILRIHSSIWNSLIILLMKINIL
jgi:hypothetical protein